jgi:hypothetical protein
MKMTQGRKCVPFLVLAVCMLLESTLTSAQVSVLTQHNDNQRTGANLSETILNTSNVNGNQFGQLFKLPVDDQVYASPLYVANLNIAGGTRNVVYVATVNNTIYAFDADKGGSALWTRNFNNGGRPTNNTEVGTGGLCNVYTDYTGHIGIVGTPVIDASTNTMYFVARTVEGGGTVQRLRAIDITTGNDKAAAQVVIQANGFNPVVQNQRPALTLSQGLVYIAWSSFCDFGGYHGFVMGYDASTLQQVHVFNDTPSGTQAGIWQAGQGATVDFNGDLYYMTGNGTFDNNANFGESFVKLNPSNGLGVQDWFTPSDWPNMNNGDRDLGSAGALLIPNTSLIVGGGKDGIFYLLNTNNMGHEVANDTQIVQKFQATFVHNGCATLHIHGGPVYWDSNSAGPMVYVWGENDFLRQFQFNGSTFNTSAIHTSSMTAATCGMPGCMLSVSANGGATGSGVLWANCVLSGDANHATSPGLLRAFNADNVSTELWDSQQNAGRDSCNNFSKYSYPVVANGKVYLSSFGTAGNNSGQLCVYGLLNSSPPPEGPFGGTPAGIPGTVQAENYDTGGQGVAYNVTTVNGTGNNYRSDGVDLEATADTGGGFNLGWTTGGQWFKYTVNVATAGTYTVSFRVAAMGAVTDAFHLANSAGTNLTGAVNVPATGGWQTWMTVTTTVTLPAGVQTLTLDQDNAGWNLNYAIFTAPTSGEAPFGGTPAAIPGTVMAENYDTGGQGVAYNVTSVNGTANGYRSDGVDLEAATAPATSNDLGWTAAGQWFRYTVQVATAGTYTVNILVAAPTAVADAFHISNSSGTNLSGTVAVPASGGFQTWVTVTATVTLPAGTQTLTLNQDATGWNIDSMTFALKSSSEGPFGGTPAAIPGTVQAENYDTGGQGVAYNVTTVNGTANGYRSDGVDLEATTDTGGGDNIGWTATGQWFKYTVNVATAGTHTLSFRVAAPNAVTGAFHLANSAGTNLTGAVNVPATGGWQTWTTVTVNVTLPAGVQTLTLDQDNAGWNLNYFASN